MLNLTHLLNYYESLILFAAQKSLAYKLFQNDSSNVFSSEILWLHEWGNKTIFSEDRFYIAPDIPHPASFKDLDPSNIIGHGEFSYYLDNQFKGGKAKYINVKNATDFFALKLTSKTFMNPVNLQVFFEEYNAGNYGSIMKRFSMDSKEQIDAMMGYFTMIVQEQILLTDLNGSYEQSAYARLMLKAMNDSYSTLQTLVPFEVTSRYLAAYIGVTKGTCNTYLALAIEDPDKVTKICTNYTFSDLDNVKTFLEPLYLNSTNATKVLMDLTGMTQAEVNNLYNTSITGSFGAQFVNQTQFLHDWYGCEVLPNKCTDDEFAAQRFTYMLIIQFIVNLTYKWGSSNITLGIYPPYKETTFLDKVSISVSNIWGIGKANPEYNAYAIENLSGGEKFTINVKSVASIFNNITGLLSQQRASIFIINVMKGDDPSIQAYNKLFGIPSSKGFLHGLRYMVQDYVMGGLYSNEGAQQWLYGIDSSIFNLVSSGEFFQGNDKDLISTVNPIFNMKTLRVSQNQIKINTGASDPYQVGKVQQLNQKAFVNSLVDIYDGNQSQPLGINVWSKEVLLDHVSNGLQFPPQTTEDDVRAFDNLFQRPFTYKKEGSNKYDGPEGTTTTQIYTEKDLSGTTGDELTTTFPGTLSIGPAFNLDLVLAKQGCMNCDQSLTSKVLVNQQAYSKAVPQVDSFYSEIEQVSGFMINHQKQVSVFIQLKTDQCLPFPSLDKIGKQLIPLYDVTENLGLDIDDYQESFGFIDHRTSSRRKATLAFITLSIVFFILTIISTAMVCIKRRNAPLSYSEITN